MDTNRFINAANLIIDDLKNINNETYKFEVESEKNEYYLNILRINHKAQLFIDKFKLPKIDYSLINDNMFNPDINFKNLKYFKPVEYQFNLLLFLFQYYEKYKISGLRFIIDDFVEKIKNKLNIKDIEITRTGAVRCKTNIRFAIMSLRHFGLINYYDTEDKRNWSPTLLGFFVCTYFILFKLKDKDDSELEHLEPALASVKTLALDNRIEDIIKELADQTKFNELTNELELPDVKKEIIVNFKKFITEYSSLINKYYTSVYPEVFTKKFLNDRIKALLRDDSKIDKFKNELIDTAAEHIIMVKVNKILNNTDN